MGIVNAGQLAVYEDIEPELKEHVEDVIFWGGVPMRPSVSSSLQAASKAKAHVVRSTSPGVKPPVGQASRVCACARRRRLHRGRHRRGAR